MSGAVQAITRLHLQHFRNYPTLELEVAPRPVVLIGKNGAGKTNILEAISLFSPGRGFRKSSLKEMENTDQSFVAPWQVSITLHNTERTHTLGTARDASTARDMRILKINGERVRAQSELCKYVSISWLTPQMDMLFLEGATARRKFFDRLVYGFDPEHAVRVAAYEHAMRERNALLKDRMADPQWLSVLEEQMAAHSVAITIARAQMLERLMHHMHAAQSPFARSVCTMEGTLEGWLASGMSALEAEAALRDMLQTLRPKDAARGRASEGAHRCQFLVLHQGKNRAAEHCSTGEQKSLLLALLIHHAQSRSHWCLEPPILLLDEVVSHLDVDARKDLFDALIEGGMQAWMTGTDAADFSGIAGVATEVKVDAGCALKKTM